MTDEPDEAKGADDEDAEVHDDSTPHPPETPPEQPGGAPKAPAAHDDSPAHQTAEGPQEETEEALESAQEPEQPEEAEKTDDTEQETPEEDEGGDEAKETDESEEAGTGEEDTEAEEREEEAAEREEEPAEEPPEEAAEDTLEQTVAVEPEPGATLAHDGLESGLAWFGEPPFVPPMAPGATPAGQAIVKEAEAEALAPGAAPALTAAQRRQRVKERVEARRREVQAKRTWYQRVPIPVWFTLPATIFIVVYVIVVRPWDRIPDPTEPLDAALLAAPAVADQDETMHEQGITWARPEQCWRLLATGELVMDAARGLAAVAIEPKETLKKCEVSCEVCLVGDSQTVWLSLDEAKTTALGLEAKRRAHYIRKHCYRGLPTETPYDIQSNYWYRLKIRVEPPATRFFINGYELKAVESCPKAVEKVVLIAQEARAAFRNWKITPLE